MPLFDFALSSETRGSSVFASNVCASNLSAPAPKHAWIDHNPSQPELKRPAIIHGRFQQHVVCAHQIHGHRFKFSALNFGNFPTTVVDDPGCVGFVSLSPLITIPPDFSRRASPLVRRTAFRRPLRR